MNRRKKHLGLCGANLLLLSTGLWFVYGIPCLREPRIILGTHDRWAYFTPMAYYLDRSLHQGVFPLWNSLTSCGTPFAANPQTAAFYPPNVLRGLLTFHPTPLNSAVGLAVLTALHLLLAGYGAYCLARHFRLHSCAASTVSIGFVFSAAMMIRVVDTVVFVYILSWLPFELLFIRQAFCARSSRRRLRAAIAAGFVLGLSALAGFPQFTLYMGATTVAYGTWHLFHVAVARSGQDTAGSTVRFTLRGLLLLTVVLLLSVCIAAPLLFPAFEFAGHSTRTKEAVDAGLNDPFQMTILFFLRGLLEFPGISWPNSCGIRMAGVGVLLLAIAALWHPRRRDTLPLLFLFLAALDCSLAPRFPIGRLLAWLAPFQIAAPARASLFACCFLTVLAGFGVDALARMSAKHRTPGMLHAALFLGVGAAILGLVGYWLTDEDASLLVIPRLGFPAALFAAAAWALNNRGNARRTRSLMFAFVLAETLAWNITYVSERAAGYPYPGSMDALKQTPVNRFPNRRGISCEGLENQPMCENLPMFLQSPSIGGYDPLYLQRTRTALCPTDAENRYDRQLAAKDITEGNERGVLLLKRRFWLAREYVSDATPSKDTLFPPTTTAYLSGANALPVPTVSAQAVPPHAVSAKAQTEPLSLNDNDWTMTRAANVEHGQPSEQCIELPVLRTGSQHAALTMRCAFSRPTTLKPAFTDTDTNQTEWGMVHHLPGNGEPVTLEWPLPDMERIKPTIYAYTNDDTNSCTILEASLLRDPEDENSLLTVNDLNSNSVEVLLKDLPGPRLLSFIESAYPGWSAFIDGKQTPVYSAFDAFEAVSVPPGTHLVRFAFTSNRAKMGLLLALFATVVAVVVWKVSSRLEIPQ